MVEHVDFDPGMGGDVALEGVLEEVDRAPATPEGFARVLEGFAGVDAADRNWFHLVEVMLRWCRSNQDAYFHVRDQQGWVTQDRVVDIARELDDLIPRSGSNLVPRATIDRLHAYVHENCWELTDESAEQVAAWLVVVAHAVGVVIEDAFSERWSNMLRHDGHLQLEPGRAYPVHAYDPRAFVDEELGVNSKPRPQAEEIDALRTVRLGDPVTRRHDFIIDFDSFGRAGFDAVEALRIATCHPNLSRAELVEDRFEVTSSGGGSDSNELRVRISGPRDLEAQVDVLKDQILTAADAGANVIVIPEYALTREAHVRLRNQLAGDRGLDEVAIIVAGIVDIGSDDEHVNQAWLWCPGRGARIHEAIGTGFTEWVAKGIPADSERGGREDISPTRPARFVVWRSGADWAFTILICRDAMDGGVVEQLALMGVNLCLVPAHTPKTASLFGSVSMLRTVSQAFVALANGPSLGSEDAVEEVDGDDFDRRRAEAVFDGPYASTVNAVELPWDGIDERGRGRGVWLFDARTRTARWFDSPPSG